MEHFKNTMDTKEGTDGQKMKKIQMDCDMRLWKTVGLSSLQSWSRLSSFKMIYKSYLFAMKLLFCHFDSQKEMLLNISFTEYLAKFNKID